MKKTLLIIHKEYLSRILKKSFVVTTLLGPVFMILTMIIPIGLNMKTADDEVIMIWEPANGTFFLEALPDLPNLSFVYLNGEKEKAINDFKRVPHDYLWILPNPKDSILKHELITKKILNDKLKNELNFLFQSIILKEKSINVPLLETSILKDYVNLDQDKELLSSTLGILLGAMIYFFIFLYGIQVMKGVTEEKTSRVVEIIITSVRPFQLMLGKIIGILLVGLTQLACWIVCMSSIYVILFQYFKLDRFSNQNIEFTTKQLPDIEQALEMNSIVSSLEVINFPIIGLFFIIFWLLGYILYSSLFAAVGSMIDGETDTQQFIFPITFPLVFCVIISQYLIQNPDNLFVQFLAYCPLTSPVVMMLFLPLKVFSIWKIILSLVILFVSVILFVLFAGKVYRVAILMYGNKANWSMIWKYFVS